MPSPALAGDRMCASWGGGISQTLDSDRKLDKVQEMGRLSESLHLSFTPPPDQSSLARQGTGKLAQEKASTSVNMLEFPQRNSWFLT